MQKKRNQSIDFPIAVGGMNNVLPPDRIGKTQATQLINVSYVNDKFQGSKKFKLNDSRLFKYLYSVKTKNGFKLYATGETVLYNITDNISYDMEDVIVDMISNADGVYCATKQALLHIDNNGNITKQLFYICEAEPYNFSCGNGFNYYGQGGIAVIPTYYHDERVQSISCTKGFSVQDIFHISSVSSRDNSYKRPVFSFRNCNTRQVLYVDVFQLRDNYKAVYPEFDDRDIFYYCYTYYSLISYNDTLSAVMKLEKRRGYSETYSDGSGEGEGFATNYYSELLEAKYYSVISYTNNTKFYTYQIFNNLYPFYIFEKHNNIYLALEPVNDNNNFYLNLWKYREGEKSHTSHRINFNNQIMSPPYNTKEHKYYAKIVYDKKLNKYILLFTLLAIKTKKTFNYIAELDIETYTLHKTNITIKSYYEFENNYCIIDYFYSKDFNQYMFIVASIGTGEALPYQIYFNSGIPLLIKNIGNNINFHYLCDRRVMFPDNWETNPDFPLALQIAGDQQGYKISLDSEQLFKGEIKCLLYQYDRLVVGQGSELTYSAVGDFHDWNIEKSEEEQNKSGAKFLEVGYKDTGHISHAFVIYDNIILFKDNGKIFRVAGFLDTWHVSQLGTIKPLTSNIYSYNGALLFGTKDGVKILNTTQAYGDFLVSDFQNNIIDNEVTHISSSQERNTIIFCAKDYVFEYHPTLQIFYVYQKEVYTHMQEYFNGSSYTQYAIGTDGKLYKESEEYNDVEVQRALIHNQYNIVIKSITIYTEPLEEDTELTIELYPNVSFTKTLKQGQSKHKIFQVKRLKELQLKYKHKGTIFITNTVIEVSFVGA